MTEIAEIAETNNAKNKVIVAPLDWGLGHATRCIPIIRKLLNYDYEVIIAAEGFQKKLLQQEFPFIEFVDLKGYRLNYGYYGWLTSLKIILQIPKILTQIKREKTWLEKISAERNIDAIISDNRYGLSSKKIVSVFLTHQLYIKTPFGNLIEKKLQSLNYKYINRFSFCWIPDLNDPNSLAGILSHSVKNLKIPVSNIGLLSRFKKKEVQTVYKILFLLSGPEPQRTILENIFLKELKSFKENSALVRGLPGEAQELYVSSFVKVYNHLPSEELNELICQSELIICRSGYSTMMDLATLGKKSIIIPTPGQSEQEYLADYLYEKKLAFMINQNKFSLRKAIDAAEKFPLIKFEEINNNLLDKTISELTMKIKASKKA